MTTKCDCKCGCHEALEKLYCTVFVQLYGYHDLFPPNYDADKALDDAMNEAAKFVEPVMGKTECAD
jgi:hypothetical protein